MHRSLVKLVLSCILYTLIHHYFSPTNFGDHFTSVMTAVRSLIEYSLIFLIFTLPIILLGFLFAKIRKKKILSYFNSTLLIGWVFSLWIVWGGWYSDKTLAEFNGIEPHKTASINKVNNAQVLKDKKKLAYCSGVLAYAANYYMLQNEIGKAKVFVLQHARSYGALLYMNPIDFSKSIDLEKSIGLQVKAKLDSDKSAIPLLAEACITDTKKLIDKHEIIGRRTPDDGTYYTDFVQILAKKNQEQLGIN